MTDKPREHRPIGGRRGEADGGAKPGDGWKKLLRRRLLQLNRRGADAKGKQHVAAEAEREGERRRTDETVVRTGPEHVAGV